MIIYRCVWYEFRHVLLFWHCFGETNRKRQRQYGSYFQRSLFKTFSPPLSPPPPPLHVCFYIKYNYYISIMYTRICCHHFLNQHAMLSLPVPLGIASWKRKSTCTAQKNKTKQNNMTNNSRQNYVCEKKININCIKLKKTRQRLDGKRQTLWAVSSGSTVLANSTFVVFSALRVNVCWVGYCILRFITQTCPCIMQSFIKTIEIIIFRWKHLIVFFHIFAQNINCSHTLEPP